MTAWTDSICILAKGSPRGGILWLILAAMIVVIMFFLIGRVKRCPANKALVISGKTGQPGDAPRCVTGGTAFVWPLIQAQAQDIILGQMRAVIAAMRIEDISRDRQTFMAAVNEAVAVDLEKIGLAVINVNIRDIEMDSTQQT